MYKLYIGNETYISLSQAKKFVTLLRENSDNEYITLDVEKVKASDLVDLLSSPSLFSTSRLIFLKRVYRNKERESIVNFLLEYLPNNTTDQIVIWEDQKVSAVTRYVKFFKSNKQLEEYTKFNKRSFLTWAKEITQKMDISINSNAINLLATYSNYDSQRFENNLKKLKLIEKDNITEEDIREFSPDTLEEDIWKLLDEINSESGKPLLILENLLRNSTDPHYIIAMILRNIRLLTMTKHLVEKNTQYTEMPSILKIPPFTLSPLVSASNRYTKERISKIYEKLSSLDYEIKVGRIEPKLGLTLLCTIL
ncbi:MAG: DNA polymerase III subunit delta [Candidatus Dojkabacteria bacterium]|jgi:DNA polymerase-3 subunit delta|nr:DNA polymerase III subunit delta [Candidatus Dojkabacteria bacterium]